MMMLPVETQREKLKSKSLSFKSAIFQNVDDIKSESINIGKSALIGGGVLLAAYLILRLFSSSEEEQVNETNKEVDGVVVVHAPKRESFLYRSIISSISVFLLSIAKQKIVSMLNKKESKPIEK